MALTVSDLSDEITQSDIRTMSVECERLGGINLAQGICDLDMPEIVRSAAAEAMAKGENYYTRHDGTDGLRTAIAEKVRAYNGITADPETEIIVSAGTTGAFYCTCMALLEKGDEVILFEPYYGYHLATIAAVGARATYVSLRPPEWTFDADDLQRAATSRTKAIMVCTPSNPCGKVFSRAELDIIADFAVRNDLFVFTDEIYEYVLFDGRKHVSPGALEAISDRTITIGGYSKTYSITGWRIGYAVCDRRWSEIIGQMNDLIYVCAPAPLQWGVAAGIRQLPSSYYEDLCRAYLQKRDSICNALRNGGLAPLIPQGAYYVLADIAHLPGESDKEKAMFLLRETGVASVPGSAFYRDSADVNLARFCFAKSDEDLADACHRLSRMS